MDTALVEKIKKMESFHHEYVHNFICNLGLSDDIDFLPEKYNPYIKKDDFRLYVSPSVLADVLIRLKPFIGVNSFNYYVNYEPIEYDYNLFDLFEAFLAVSSIRTVECKMTDTPMKCDIAYVGDGVKLSDVDKIISTTKNVVIFENLYNTELLELLQFHKKDNVISYYMQENTDNAKASVAVLYKDFEMFD